uniref:TRP C-terminal domain-containing protein n=1 Tax=Amphimedon queenslandica TaxID=400682 RepID=A0A1X7TRB4_AMPQE
MRSGKNVYNSSLSIIADSGYGNYKIRQSISINFLNCPIGFQFTDVTNNCTCDNIFKKLKFKPVCKISSHLFINNSNPLSTISRYYMAGWIGLVNLTSGTTAFGAAKSCHLFCYLDSIHNLFLVKGTDIKITNKDLSDAAPLCTTNRRGPLCSQCSPGYSVVFGSIRCSKCSNWWLLTTLAYAVAGPLFIYLLYALRLTLTTGTMNGIVFYAQILVTYNQFNLRSRNFVSVFYSISNGLISLLNLNINFNYPICLYNGMTEAWKFALSLVFPIYLMVIVVLLIIISRYSVKLSNKISVSSIQVLVTVVHLSFSSFLVSVQNVYTYSIIHLNTTDVPLHVWLRDGTTEYGSGSHLVLMIMTSLIVWPILIVYVGILLFGRLVMKINRFREYLRPVYEAIHAPYKYNREFFFPAQLLVVVFCYILFCQIHEEHFSSFCIFTMILWIIYIFSAALFPPYKASWLNYLNLLIQFIALLIAILMWYLFFISNMNGLVLAFNFGTMLILLIFFAIVIGHVLWVKGKLKKLNLYFKARYSSLCQNSKRIYSAKRKQLWLNIEDSFFDSYSETREPLLSPD